MSPEETQNAYRLVTAAVQGDVETLRAVLDTGADVHFQEDLPLRAAAYTGQLACMKILVTAGADVKAHFNEALYVAAKAGDGKMVDFLLDHGADPDIALKFHGKKMDAAATELINGRSLRDSFEKAQQDQAVIANLAHEAREKGLKFNLRPPRP
ncbi:MAG: ankyrin repeat domain-containing protein [Bdellovibrionales bacterium]|jgi:ankyrin repeat protein|nr:ankyrin repeat domain-containing protein [Bdellovibrionales bacterium]